MTLDFSESDAQRPGFVNCIYAATYGTAVGSAILFMDPALADYHNEGSLRPITVIAPVGSVLNCEYPATVGGSPVAVGEQIIEAVIEALSKARPERALAPWGKHRGDYTSGTTPATGGPTCAPPSTTTAARGRSPATTGRPARRRSAASGR